MLKKWGFALYIGFFAGLIWGVVRELFYFLEFTKVPPAFMLQPWMKADFIRSAAGQWTGLGVFIVFSLVAACLYMVALSKARGPWPGITYGLAWWAALFIAIGPFAGMTPKLGKLDIDSMLSDACLFVLWGVFIGYSIALEFTDERAREPGLQ